MDGMGASGQLVTTKNKIKFTKVTKTYSNENLRKKSSLSYFYLNILTQGSFIKFGKFFQKNYFLPPDTHRCMYISGGTKCLFSENFANVLNERHSLPCGASYEHAVLKMKPIESMKL